MKRNQVNQQWDPGEETRNTNIPEFQEQFFTPDLSTFDQSQLIEVIQNENHPRKEEITKKLRNRNDDIQNIVENTQQNQATHNQSLQTAAILQNDIENFSNEAIRNREDYFNFRSEIIMTDEFLRKEIFDLAMKFCMTDVKIIFEKYNLNFSDIFKANQHRQGLEINNRFSALLLDPETRENQSKEEIEEENYIYNLRNFVFQTESKMDGGNQFRNSGNYNPQEMQKLEQSLRNFANFQNTIANYPSRMNRIDERLDNQDDRLNRMDSSMQTVIANQNRNSARA